MKIAEYKQMMAYLTRPKFNGGGSVGSFVKPKKKPKEEAEKVNKERKEKNFEKVKGALENPKEVKEMMDLADGGRIPFGIGGLTAQEIGTLKQAIKDGKLTQAEYNKLSVKPPADSTNFGGGRKGMEKRNWLGVTQRGNKKLFRKVKSILNPGAQGTGAKLFLNEKARNIITKAANAGKNNQEIVKLLEKAKVDFGGTGVPKVQKVGSAVNALVQKGAVDEIYTRSGQALKNTGELTDFELKQKVKSTVEDLIKNPEKYKDKSLSTIQKETLGRLDEKGRVDVLKGEIKRQLGDKRGTKFIQDNFETTTAFSKKRLEALLKNKKIQNLLKSKDVSFEKLEKQIAKVLKVDINSNTPSNAAYRLAEVIKDQPDFVDVEIPRTYLNSAEKILDAGKISGLEDPFGSIKRQRMEKKIAKELGESSTFFSKLRKQTGISGVFSELAEEIGGPFKKLVDISTDELGTIKGPYKYGSEGDSIFMQSLTKTGNKTVDNINLEKGKTMDKKLVEIRKLIAESKTFPTKEVEQYNRDVRKIAREMNANLGLKAKKIRPFIIVPGGDPTKTIANFAQIAKQNPDVAQKIINDARTFGYSAQIPRDVPTAFQLQDRGFVRKNIVDNLKKFYDEFDEKELFKKIRNQTPKQIRDIFGKGRKFLRFVEAEPDNRRFVAANNIMTDATYVDPIEKSGRSMLDFIKDNPFVTGTSTLLGSKFIPKTGFFGPVGKFAGGVRQAIRKTPGLAFRGLGTPAALAYAATGGFKRPPDLSKTGDRIALETLAAFGKEGVRLGQGFASQIAKGVRSLPFGKQAAPFVRKGVQTALGARGLPPFLNPRVAFRAARALTPIGLASLGLEGLYQAGKYGIQRRKELQEMSPEQRQELSRQSDEFSFGEAAGAAGGGLLKQAGDRSGKPPEAGPTPQGLDFLMKRGR